MDKPLLRKLLRAYFIWWGCAFATAGLTQEKYLTFFETSHETESAVYQEVIAYYQQLANQYEEVKLTTFGTTDCGEPLHLVMFSPDRVFDVKEIKAKEKAIVLIMNGIHAGEPDGIDASMMLLRDLLTKKRRINFPKNTVLAIIPVYNVGGALNRNSTSRVNQNGPKEYGFRGNAKNYDLNRDFIKMDSKNARSFIKLYHYLDPDVLVDTHVSNGADYQHVITLIASQKNKMDKQLATYQEEELVPDLFREMEKEDFPMAPYVNVFGTTPDKGYSQFMDYPRYSSGYVSLFGTLGFITEAHMLKPYFMRVKATHQFLWQLLKAVDKDVNKIIELRRQAKQNVRSMQQYTVQWEVDSTMPSYINFKGYEAREIPSKVTGLNRLYYDKNMAFEKEIPFYNNYQSKTTVKLPKTYIIPQAWYEVVEKMALNGVRIDTFKKDTVLAVENYKIENYLTYTRPYEGHYPHYQTEISVHLMDLAVRKGDFMVHLNQIRNRYIAEVLEPQANDSFFNWNFFDPILQRKEGFSPYVFEEIAERILFTDKDLFRKFQNKKQNDQDFAANAYQQLDFIYSHSVYSEKAYKSYPVYRLMK